MTAINDHSIATPAELIDRPAIEPRRLGTIGKLMPIALLGAALNIFAYGFLYGQYNHTFDLAMLNWLRDPTLYPGDVIREGFARYPTIFWRAVALVPHEVSTEALLFGVFLLTKFLFFFGLARIARFAIPDSRFVRLATVTVALAFLLNFRMPFGVAQLLDPVQTQSPLAIAVLVCACASLLDGQWIVATVLAAASIYLSVPYTVYALFAFVALALVDLKLRLRTVLLSGLLGAALIAPWFVMNLRMLRQPDPPNYVSALLLFYPLHLKFSSHHFVDQVYGPLFPLAAFVVTLWAHKKRSAPDSRLEAVAASFSAPVLLGVVAGQVHLTPLLARMQLMRADVFLFLFSTMLLLVSVYKMALNDAIPFPWVTLPVGFLFFLVPETPLRLSLLVLGGTVAFWGDCREFLRRTCAYLEARPPFRRLPRWTARASLVAIVCVACAGLLAKTVRSAPFADMFAIPGRSPDSWSALQTWARDNTPRNAVFLVPTFMEGFRVLSERSSWGEWKDGTAVYLYPQFADTYISRMRDVGWLTAPDFNGRQSVEERYKALSWSALLALARKNHLQYVVQYSDVPYPDAPAPVYGNPDFAVYKVQP